MWQDKVHLHEFFFYHIKCLSPSIFNTSDADPGIWAQLPLSESKTFTRSWVAGEGLGLEQKAGKDTEGSALGSPTCRRSVAPVLPIWYLAGYVLSLAAANSCNNQFLAFCGISG